MFSLDTLLEQIRQFEKIQGMKLFMENGAYDLTKLQTAILDRRVTQLIKAIQMNLVFYIVGHTEGAFNEEHAQELAAHGYSVARIFNRHNIECWVNTSIGPIKV